MSVSPLILLAGALIVFVGAIVYLVGLGKKWGILVPFAGMLLFGSMALPLDWNDRVMQTVWLPIQTQRSALFLGMGVVGLSVVLIQFGRFVRKPVSVSAVFLLMMGLYAALLRFVHDGSSEGASSVVFAFSTLVPLVLVSTISIDEPTDFLLVTRVIAAVNAVWVGMCGVQFLADPRLLTLGNQFRFMGILSNPQHAGALMAFMAVIMLWLLFNDSQKRFKLIYMGLIFANILLLIWTGSRTGLGMFMIGMSAVLYTKAGRTILFLPIVAIVAYVGIKFLINTLGLEIGVERLASTENTRDYAWWKLYSTGMENPLFGVGTLESEKSENSWLFGFAAFGIGMLALSVMFTLSAVWECWRLVRTRHWLPAYYRPYSDLMVGVMAMYFAGAVLEGYMVSRVSASMCIYPAIAGAGAMFRRFARQYHEAGYVEDDSYGGESAYEDNEAYGDGGYGDQEFVT